MSADPHHAGPAGPIAGRDADRGLRPAHYPARAPIDAYGNGGFRFADMSHRGAILCLPSGIYGWAPAAAADHLRAHDLDAALAELAPPAFLILGTGAQHLFAPPELEAAFRDRGVGLETMSTGAAARTYNILLGEGRAVAAALYPVD